MLKRLAILAVVLGALQFGGPGVAQNQQPQPSTNQNASYNEGRDKQGNFPPCEVGKTQPDSKKPCQAESKDKKDGDPNIPRPWYKLPEWVSIDVSAVSTVIAFLTLVFFAIQVWLMRMTAHRQLRAYVVAETGSIVNVADPIHAIGPKLAIYKFSFINKGRENPAAFYEYPRVRLRLMNYGQSPAFLRKYAIGYSWDESVPKKFTWYPFEDQVIDAGCTYEFNEVDLGVLESPPQTVIEDLVRSKKHLTFSGWVGYSDLFDSPVRKLTFCRELIEYDPDPAKMMVMDTSALSLWTDPSED